MELRQLRYFSVLAEELHFARAAGRLHITQPALSRQIRELESELEAVLFDRAASGNMLTPAGRRFRKHAALVLAAAERAAQAVRPVETVLRVGHYGSVWMERFAPAFRDFSRRSPGVRVEAAEFYPAELPAALRERRIDLALFGALEKSAAAEFATREIDRVESVLVLGAQNPRAKRRIYALAELATASWAVFEEATYPGRAARLLGAARAAGFRARITHRVQDLASLFLLVSTTDAIGCVAPMARKFAPRGVAFAGLRPPGIAVPMYAGWRKRERNPEIERLVETLAATRD